MSSKITFLLSIFAAFMVAFGGLEAFCLFEEVDDRYPKSLCMSLKNVSDRIYQTPKADYDNSVHSEVIYTPDTHSGRQIFCHQTSVFGCLSSV